jgi:hypothetical protein
MGSGNGEGSLGGGLCPLNRIFLQFIVKIYLANSHAALVAGAFELREVKHPGKAGGLPILN